MIATYEQPAPQVIATGQAVQPRDGVFVTLIRLGGNFKELVNVRKANLFHLDKWAGDALQLDLGPGDQARQTQAADCGAVKVGVFGWRACQPFAVRSDQLKAGHVRAKRPGDVMVLAVDVVGNRAADRDKFSTRHDWQEPAFQDNQIENLGQRYARFTAQNALRGVK